MSEPAREPAKRLKVRAIMLERNKRPHVELFDERRECIARLPACDAHTLAHDITKAAARSEADAMIYRFFKREHFPEEGEGGLPALAALDGAFRKSRELLPR